MMEDAKVSTGEPGPNDVVFDCVSCGRSLCIDTVASGFTIICPHCSTEQQVPGEMMESEESVEGGMDASADVEELRLQKEQIENMLAVQQGRLEQISREMALIQAAIDRIVGLLQDSQVEPSNEDSGG